MIEVLIAHNDDPDPFRWIEGYKIEHEVRHVFSYSTLEPELFPDSLEGDKGICEQAFHLFNAPEEYLSNAERSLAREYRAKNLRSLSVGDLVFVKRGMGLRAWACDAVGWSLVTNEPRLTMGQSS